MSIFWTADLHFGHQNIIKYCNRPFSSVEEMDESLIKKWNQKVQPADTVWIIGDFAFANKERMLEILLRLNGIKKLVPGNHDGALLKSEECCRQFAEIHHGIHEIKIGSQFIVMCHYPLMSWNRSFHGSYHLHGHTHGGIKFDEKYRRLDVGVDVSSDFSPISFQEIVGKMNLVSFT